MSVLFSILNVYNLMYILSLLGLVATGPGRYNVNNNGGCWQESRNGLSMSACVVSYLKVVLLFFPH